MKKVTTALTLVATFVLSACAGLDPCQNLTGTALQECRATQAQQAQARAIAAAKAGGDGGGHQSGPSGRSGDFSDRGAAQRDAGKNGESNVSSTDSGASFGGIGS